MCQLRDDAEDRFAALGWLAMNAQIASAQFPLKAGTCEPPSMVHNRPLRRLVRAIFWFKAITDYMRDEDNIKIAHASLTVWILLTTGWLLSLGSDRILRPLGLQP